MKTIDVRSLIDESKSRKIIMIPENIQNIFELWKKRITKIKKGNLNELEIFYAGYLLANPILREELDKSENPEKYKF